jgi:hypothetical protein
MKIHRPQDYSNLEIINLVITLHTDHHDFVQNWSEFIFGKEVNLPPELKNRIFCIWMVGVMDLVEDYFDQNNHLREQCLIRGLTNCVDLLEEMEVLINSICSHLEKIDVNQQILIYHQRNCLVHGRILSIHRKKLGKLKFFDPKSRIIQEFKGSKEQFWDIHRKIVTGTMDEFLSLPRSTFFDIESEYYKIIAHTSRIDFFNRVSSKAYLDR